MICVVNAGSAPIPLPAGDLLPSSVALTSLTEGGHTGALALPPDTAARLAAQGRVSEHFLIEAPRPGLAGHGCQAIRR